MNINDPIGDMITRIRNAQRIGKKTTFSPFSRLRCAVLDVLMRSGYIRHYEEVNLDNGLKDIRIELKYLDGEPVIRHISRVSTPGRRSYFGSKKIPAVRNHLGISILSTSKGVMSDVEAKAANVGGELLCRVF
jgi:small subunit ribosomal protein S8